MSPAKYLEEFSLYSESLQISTAIAMRSNDDWLSYARSLTVRGGILQGLGPEEASH